KQYLDNGWIGYANDGLVAIVSPDQIPLKERASVAQLVAAENQDRKALYEAIARANGRPEWTDEIRTTFARRWIANAEPGWLIQNPDGRWQRK
ncbi:MAG: YdbL family protein, partial [Methylohalobius sp.]